MSPKTTRNFQEWAASEDGKAAIQKACEQARLVAQLVIEQAQVTPEQLRRPVTPFARYRL